LKGSALCYNATTGNLVSFNSRQRMVSVQQRDGSIRSEITGVQGAATAHKPLLASTGSELVVLAAFDGPLQVRSFSECGALQHRTNTRDTSPAHAPRLMIAAPVVHCKPCQPVGILIIQHT
jgi:hypothetical protein